MGLIRLSAVITSILDSFRPSNQETYETCVSTVSNFEVTDASVPTNRTGRQIKPSLKGGCTLWDSARQHWALLGFAAIKDLMEAYNALCEVLQEVRMRNVLSSEGTVKQRLNSANRYQTISLKLTGNCCVSILIRFVVFKNSILLLHWPRYCFLHSSFHPVGKYFHTLIAYRCCK